MERIDTDVWPCWIYEMPRILEEGVVYHGGRHTSRVRLRVHDGRACCRVWWRVCLVGDRQPLECAVRDSLGLDALEQFACSAQLNGRLIVAIWQYAQCAVVEGG